MQNIASYLYAVIANPGLLEIPTGKSFIDMPIAHFQDLVKTKGRTPIIRGLVNLESWNKKKNPEISQHAREIINALPKG